MKTSAILSAALVASASAFAPANNGARMSTELNKSLFDVISGMDLFAPQADQNDYGARGKKNLKVGKLGDKSYVPAGLTKAQYEAIRSKDSAKKDSNYKKNVAKAGIFQDYTDFYIKRGTDTSESWFKSPNRGHTMAKTKYDWDKMDDKPLWAKGPTKKK
eukprot:CAMPEP_0184857762 /NCGR_PEP_ID=MMETSP0580-20130426/2908_1 /TAXON_ID=1118495 /ORGANISM="Dactyliosolen fragilissimus" /LENGTH=159 /DNA_ID=CAMNT_0027353543 /DNA_START=69 /DNA_END=548 /DNA_ORIENTATION=-